VTDRLEDYDYALPAERIAQEPPAARGDSRLLVLDRRGGRREHRRFRELPEFLCAGDLMVLNETRVFPARLRARRATGGRVEVLLLEPAGPGEAWNALGRPAKAFKPGESLALERDAATAHPLRREGALVIIEFRRGGEVLSRAGVLELCERAGEMPLPPYIRRAGDERQASLDRLRYQTIYARRTGAVAAPTAGLHFTAEVLEELKEKGVRIAPVTLHIGAATFQPLTEASLGAATMAAEMFEIGVESGEEIRRARRDRRRIIATGTTSVRALESFGSEKSLPLSERTDLYIKPGYTFQSVGALITNFHLPKSSLLLLVCAFAGRELVLETYAEAVREEYRFYSYGDAMLIL
jgi:S-adenosylmethionine:tRNA ribosyltransferase-isomerase